MPNILLPVLLLALCGCASAEADPPNVLLVIADDLGVDQIGVYRASSADSLTPRIDQLANTGVRFTNAWSDPICSPTRATILTGRYGFRTGVGWIATPYTEDVYAIPVHEYTLPDALATVGVNAAHIGKWHLGNGEDGPNLSGWSHYSGWTEGKLPDFYNWTKITNGVAAEVRNYATTETVDDALEWLGQQAGPWVLWLAFNAPHKPFHKPPDELHTFHDLSTEPAVIDANPLPYYQASVQALDSEIGRLLDALDDATRANTLVIFLGDNGTPKEVSQPPFLPSHAKATLYQGGVNVPLVLSGALVATPGRAVDRLVNTTDIFATILEAVGFSLDSLPKDRHFDAVSLLPYLQDTSSPSLRSVAFAEQFQYKPGSESYMGKTMRTRQYKVIRFDDGRDELYDLVADPLESVNLLLNPLTPKQKQAYEVLTRRLAVLLESEL